MRVNCFRVEKGGTREAFSEWVFSERARLYMINEAKCVKSATAS